MQKQPETPQQNKKADDNLFKFLIGAALLFTIMTKFTVYFIIGVVLIIGLGIFLYSKRPKFKALVNNKLQKINVFKRNK